MKHIICTIFFLSIGLTSFGQLDKDQKTFDPTFVHSVYFWLKNPDVKEDRAKFEKAIYKLLQNSKYTKTNFLGAPPKAKRDVVDGSYTYALVVTFESAEAQDNYQGEEVHLQFIEEAKNLWDKVLVYDAKGIAN